MTGFVGRLQAKLGLDSVEFINKMREARAEGQGLGPAVATGMRALSGFAMGASAAIGTVAGVGLAVRSVTAELADMGDQARRAGLDVETWQEWGHVMRQNRIPIDLLTDGFRELQIRADEFIQTDAGPAEEAFNRLGLSVDDLKNGLREPSELVLEIFNRLQRFNNADRTRILDELFGGSAGDRFLQLMGQSERAIRATMAEARDLGLVVGEDIVASAVILDQKFAELTTRAQRFFQAATVSLFAGGVEAPAETLERLFGTLEQARVALGDDMFGQLIAQTSELGDATEAALGQVTGALPPMIDAAGQASGILTELVRLLAASGQTNASEQMRLLNDELVNMMTAAADGSLSVADFRAYLDSALSGAQDLLGGLESVDNATFAGVMGRLSSLITRLGEAAQAGAAASGSLPGSLNMTTGTPLNPSGPLLPGDANMPSSPRPPRAPRDIDFDLPPEADSGSSQSLDGYAAAAAAIRERTEALLAEASAIAEVTAADIGHGDALDYARARAELLLAAQREGRELTPELRAEIDELARSQVEAADRVESLTDALESQGEAAERGASALAGIFTAGLRGSDAARDAVARLILEIARLQAMRAFQGIAASGSGGGFLSFIGSLIGKNARGTESWRGGLTVVGEEGPELVDLPTGAKITPALATAEKLRNGGGSGSVAGRIEVALSPDLEARILDTAAQNSVTITKDGLAQADRALPARVAQIRGNPRAR